MSSKRKHWKTPRKFYRGLDEVFDFDFDPGPANPDFDGFSVEWKRRNFVNPPYGSEIVKWVRKGFEENRRTKKTVIKRILAQTVRQGQSRWR